MDDDSLDLGDLPDPAPNPPAKRAREEDDRRLDRVVDTSIPGPAGCLPRRRRVRHAPVQAVVLPSTQRGATGSLSQGCSGDSASQGMSSAFCDGAWVCMMRDRSVGPFGAGGSPGRFQCSVGRVAEGEYPRKVPWLVAVVVKVGLLESGSENARATLRDPTGVVDAIVDRKMCEAFPDFRQNCVVAMTNVSIIAQSPIKRWLTLIPFNIERIWPVSAAPSDEDRRRVAGFDMASLYDDSGAREQDRGSDRRATPAAVSRPVVPSQRSVSPTRNLATPSAAPVSVPPAKAPSSAAAVALPAKPQPPAAPKPVMVVAPPVAVVSPRLPVAPVVAPKPAATATVGIAAKPPQSVPTSRPLVVIAPRPAAIVAPTPSTPLQSARPVQPIPPAPKPMVVMAPLPRRPTQPTLATPPPISAPRVPMSKPAAVVMAPAPGSSLNSTFGRPLGLPNRTSTQPAAPAGAPARVSLCTPSSSLPTQSSILPEDDDPSALDFSFVNN